MLIDRDGDVIILQAPTTSTTIVRQIPGARWDKKRDLWEFPLSWATCVSARGIIGSDLQVGPSLAEWARAEVETRIQPSLQIRESLALPPGHPVEARLEALNLGGERYSLYPYQRVGAAFLDAAGSTLLGDDMGTGKCAQTIAALELAQSYPALIISPNSVKSVWAKEFAKWAPHRKVKVAGSGTVTSQAAVQEVANGMAEVLILNWESLRSLSRLAPYGSIKLETCSNCDSRSTRRPDLCQVEDKILNTTRWAAVVADEAHRAKDPKSAQTRALWAIGDRSERRIALTGTPIANEPDDLWSIMRFVAPDEYSRKTLFVTRYVETVLNFYSGFPQSVGLKAATRAEFDKFFLPRFLRRTKAEVLPDLPPKVYERRDIYLTGRQKKAYDQMAKEMVAAIQGGTLVAGNTLTASLRLRQLASAYGTIVSTTTSNSPMATVDQQVRLDEPSSKLDELEQVLIELKGRQAVIFAESEQLISLTAKRMDGKWEYGLITGPTPQKDRDAYIEAFQSGKLPYLLVTIAAGGEGLTLTAADTAIFLQRPWSAVDNKQAEDRLHRIGQEHESVTYIDLVTVGTIEERVFEALAEKEAKLQDLVHDPQPEETDGDSDAGQS